MRSGRALQGAVAIAVCLTGFVVSPSAAQEAPAKALPPPSPSSADARLTLDEIKQRVLADNKLLNLAAMNVQSKGYATRAAQALYFPQIIGNVVYFHYRVAARSVGG